MKYKNMRIRIFILLTFFIPKLHSQFINNFQLELGTGIVSETSRFNKAIGFNLNGSLHYKIGSGDLAIRYMNSVTSFGMDDVIIYKRLFQHSTPHYKTTHVNVRESRYSRLNSIQLWLNINPTYKRFKPILGIGISKNRIGEIKQLRYDDELNVTSINIPSQNYYTIVYKFGYRINDFRYYLQLHSKDEVTRRRIYEMSLSYNFRLDRNFSSIDKRQLSRIIFRGEVGHSISIPLGKYNGVSQRYFIDLKLSIHKTGSLGLKYESKGGGIGIDKNTFEIVKNEEIDDLVVRTTNVLKEVSSIKLYYDQISNVSKNIDFYYGGGIGLYGIEKTGEYRRVINSTEIYYPPVIEKGTNFGLMLKTGVRTGIFSNSIEMNIPMGSIPVYFGINTGIGINIRKRK